jgi:hypothetical protein
MSGRKRNKLFKIVYGNCRRQDRWGEGNSLGKMLSTVHVQSGTIEKKDITPSRPHLQRKQQSSQPSDLRFGCLPRRLSEYGVGFFQDSSESLIIIIVDSTGLILISGGVCIL